MLKTLDKSIKRNQVLEMIYIDDSDQITKRRIKPFKSDKDLFAAYCFLRKSRRTFKFDNVLALVPIIQKERMVI